MADPTTGNILLSTPTRGSDSGTWDSPLNSNAIALDGRFGGAVTLGLSAASTVLLTTPSTGVVSAAAGPNQSQNSLIRFTGTLTGNIAVQFTLPGFYIIENKCVVGTAFNVQLQPNPAGGNAISAPPGRKTHVYFDGTDIDFVDMPEVGSFMDLAVSATPAWIVRCTVQPWLVCDGSLYSTSTFTALAALVGSAFGGNGVTTFAVPDLRARYRIPLDNQGANGAAGNITVAGAGINGTTWGASGGSQQLQQHNHTVTDPGHQHGLAQALSAGGGGVQFFYVTTGGLGTLTANATTNLSVNNSGTGTSGNIPPGLVHGMTFIKTAILLTVLARSIFDVFPSNPVAGEFDGKSAVSEISREFSYSDAVGVKLSHLPDIDFRHA